jgi:hypothetical protein
MNTITKSYLAVVLLAGVAVTAYALSHWRSHDLVRFGVFLVLFLAAAALKCTLPGIAGSYSPVFFFALLGSVTMSFSEVAIASALAGIVQCTVKQHDRPSFIQVCFNAANLCLSTASGFVFIQRLVPGLTGQPRVLCFILGATVFYVVNTGLVSLVLTLVEGGSVSGIWKHWCLGSLPYYFVGALIAATTLSASPATANMVVFLVAPAMLLATLCYRRWVRSGPAIFAK